MNRENVARYTRLRELVEDSEEVYKQYPWIRKLAQEMARADAALQAVRDALSPSVHQEPRMLSIDWPAIDDRRKVSAVNTIIDGYFDPRPESSKP